MDVYPYCVSCSFDLQGTNNSIRKNCYVCVCVWGAVLHFAREDEKAFYCKVVCLIQLSQFEEALKLLKNNPKLGR